MDGECNVRWMTKEEGDEYLKDSDSCLQKAVLWMEHSMNKKKQQDNIMQYKSLIIRKMKLFVLFFAVVTIPNMGFCQNTPQRVAKVDSVKKITPIAVSSQKSVVTTATFDVANPTTITYNDTALKSIQDTLNLIAENARWRFLGFESTKSNSWIGFAALLVGLLAAGFAGAGFWFQMKSAKSLKVIQGRRVPYNVFAQKMVDTSVVLDILIEIERSDISEVDKQYRRLGYEVDKLLEGMKLPDDMIDLNWYKDEIVYKIIFEWRDFNYMIDSTKAYYINRQNEYLLSSYLSLRENIKKIFNHLSTWEDTILLLELEKKYGKRAYKYFYGHNDKFSKKYLSWKIRDFRKDKISNELSDPRLFNTTNLLFDCVIFPDLKCSNKKNKKISPLKKVLRVITPKSASFSANEAIGSEMDFIYEWYDDYKLSNGNHASQYDISVSNSLETLFSEWFKSYFSDEDNSRHAHCFFIISVVYADIVACKRKEIIVWKRDFYEKEKVYFKKIQDTYEKFGFFYSHESQYGHSTLTLYDFLRGIVAEQDLDISVSYLSEWRYYTKENDEEFYYCGWNLLPLLKKFKIADDDGLIIKTKEQLDERLKDYMDDILSYKIYPLPSVEAFSEWSEKKIGVMPFAIGLDQVLQSLKEFVKKEYSIEDEVFMERLALKWDDETIYCFWTTQNPRRRLLAVYANKYPSLLEDDEAEAYWEQYNSLKKVNNLTTAFGVEENDNFGNSDPE